MYPETEHNTWINEMVGKLQHGMYWHIPSCNTVLRMDKEKRRLVIIKGNSKNAELKSLSAQLQSVGYGLITRDEEDKVNYYTC